MGPCSEISSGYKRSRSHRTALCGKVSAEYHCRPWTPAFCLTSTQKDMFFFGCTCDVTHLLRRHGATAKGARGKVW